MAVSIDTSAGNLAAAQTVSVSLTVANNPNRALVALVGDDNTLQYTGVAFTAPGTQVFTFLGRCTNGVHIQEIWYYIGPPTGSVTVQATLSAANSLDNDIMLYSVYNVDQTTPVDGYVKNETTGVVTLDIATTTGGLAVCQVVSPSDLAPILSGTQDFSTFSDRFWISGHNAASPTATMTWSAGSARGIHGCNVRQAVSVIPSTGAYQQEQSPTDRYQLEDGSGIYLIEPWGQTGVFLPPFIQGDLTGIGTPGRFFKDRLN